MAVLHGWKHCPRCATEIEVKENRVACPACGSHYYANSAPTVGGLVTDGAGRLMLVRRGIEPEKGKWDTAGGFLEEGEAPLAALKRELLEETGLEVEPGAFLGAFTDWYGDAEDAQAVLNLSWICRPVGGEERPADDVAEIGWFAADELPGAEELAFTTIHDVVLAWREVMRST